MGRLAKPRRCFGPRDEQHACGCRRGRPLCRWRRATNPKRRPCFCPAYHFPHRDGGGRCGHHERMNDFVYGPIPAAEVA